MSISYIKGILKMSIGENIKRLRELRGLSQREFGEIAGVTDKAVSTWENKIKEPRMGSIQRIADYFGLQKSNIIEDNGLDGIFTERANNAPADSGEGENKYYLEVKGMGKNIELTEEEFQVMAAYRLATPEDKEVVKCLLQRYKKRGNIGEIAI